MKVADDYSKMVGISLKVADFGPTLILAETIAAFKNIAHFVPMKWHVFSGQITRTR